jgi:hypothetical protein
MSLGAAAASRGEAGRIATPPEESMKANSLTVASAALCAVAGTLAMVLAVGAAEAQDRRPATQPAPQYTPPVPQATTPGATSTVGRPGPSPAQGNYQANYHADYSMRGTQGVTQSADPRDAPRQREPEPYGVPGLEPYARTPFGWPR